MTGRIFNYSPESAITGSSFAAFAAGLNPKKIPINTEKTNAIIQAFPFNTKANERTYSIAKLSNIPKIIPHAPPIKVILADSTRN